MRGVGGLAAVLAALVLVGSSSSLAAPGEPFFVGFSEDLPKEIGTDAVFPAAELGGTAAIYMPGGHEDDLARQLIDAGLAPDTSCFVVASASRPDEQIVQTTLGGLSALHKLPAPAILLIGAIPAGAGHAAPAQNVGKKAHRH